VSNQSWKHSIEDKDLSCGNSTVRVFRDRKHQKVSLQRGHLMLWAAHERDSHRQNQLGEESDRRSYENHFCVRHGHRQNNATTQLPFALIGSQAS
jgi:hypothetical protein